MADDPATVLQNQISALQTTVNSLQTSYNNLHNDHQNLKGQVAVLVTQGKSSSASSKPKASLPDPEKFTGAPFTFETWLPAIEAKLRIDKAAIGNSEARFYYIYSRLDGKVQALVMPQLVAAAEAKNWNPQDLLDQLTRVFDNPNKVQEAEDALHKITQGDDVFSIFLAKFERLLYKAKANTWPESAKISLLRRALNDQTRKRARLIQPIPKTYDEYLQKLKEATGYQRKDKHGFDKNGFSSHSSSKGKGKDSDEMDIDAIEASKTKASGSGSTSRAYLNTISALDDDDYDDNSDDSYDSRASHSSEDFEKTLERRHYGDGLGH